MNKLIEIDYSNGGPAVSDCELHIINHSDGHTSVKKIPKVTGKKQQYFVDMLLSLNAKQMQR